MEGPNCVGCSNIIEEGSVIAFGDSFFHLKCFTCSKCSEPVDCDSNLLLLSTGRPVCESCSYYCSACKEAISDEAIMTGDEAYHSDCFRCVSCKRKIEDLVFTQTSKGIHCTSCHEKRKALKQKRKEEREKRLQSKQVKDNASSDTIETQAHAPRPARINTSRDNSKVNNYNSYQETSTDPPTPSRSRSDSAENPPKMHIDSACPAPSKPEVLSTTTKPPSPSSYTSSNTSPNSPPLSITSSHYKSVSHVDILNPSNSALSFSTLEELPLNFSFFDNESTDLVNLTKTLGANISMHLSDKKKSITENITRASQLLETSLMVEDADYDSFPQPPQQPDTLSSANHLHVQQLHADLECANAKIATIQACNTKIKEASRQALEELSRAKDEFAKEALLRQQQDFVIAQLKQQLQLAYRARSMNRAELAAMTKEEIERVAKLRAELDRTCNELKSYRNVLAKDIESLTRQKQTSLETNFTSHLEEQQKALMCEIVSLKSDKEQVIHDKKLIEDMRDEVLHDMVMLNTKHAELTEMNNDLTRRVTEREAIYSPSPSLSSELASPVSMQRKSSEGRYPPPQPKMFKLKKKGNVFSKFSTKNKVDAPTMLYGPNSPNTSSSLNVLVSPSNDGRKPEAGQLHQHGTHAFLTTSFLRPVKCDACGEKMWGLSELRCQGCMYTTHARCLSHVPQLCHGSQTQLDLPPEETTVKLFGSDLNDRCRFEDRTTPLIIQKCIQAIEKRGMDYEGIYRKPGGAAQIRLIIQSFESDGETVDLEDEECINDICAVTSVLKQYFRDLPDPLLPYQLYSQFIDAVSSHQIGQNTIDRFSELLSQLPKSNYETLRVLIHHLNSVQQHHHENLMTIKNLAMVFGPTLLRDIESSRDLIDMNSKNIVVEYLILNVKELLP